MFGFFKNFKDKEYVEVDTDRLKNYLLEQGISDEEKVEQIIQEFKQSLENKVAEKSELTYEEFLAEVEDITGKIYTNPTNRIELCRQIDEFIENNPEVANTIKLYASYITYGAINIKLDDYRVNLISDDEKQIERARKIIEKFEKRSKIKRNIYLIGKDIVSYGDGFFEKVYDNATGRLISVAYLPSNRMIIAIDSYGNVERVYQVLTDTNISLTDMKNEVYINRLISEKKIVKFDKHEIVHFNDGTIPGFSDSPLRNLIAVWKSFKLIEEALIIHRITRARRLLIFFLDVTGKEPTKVRKLVRKFVEKLTSAFKIDITGTTISRKSMIKQGSDIVIPITKDSATKVQSIPADTSATKIDDLKFYHHRILQNLLTAHIFGDDKISRDKAEYLDAALKRIIRTYQRYMSYALEDLYQELLESYGINDVIVNIQFPTPDNEEEIKIVDTLIRRIMVINQLVATIGIVPPFEWIIKYVFKDLTQPEIQELISLLKQEKAKQEQEMQGQEFLATLENNTQEQTINPDKLSTLDLIASEVEDEVKEQFSKNKISTEERIKAMNNILELSLKYLELRNKNK